jgi:hypothetical protein
MLVSSALIGASHVDQLSNYAVADIFGNDATSTRAVIIEATYICFPTARQRHRATCLPRPRAVREWTARRAAPIPSHGGEKR